MGFEKTDDKQKSSVEGFETDVIDLDGGSEDIRAVKAPRRSSRKEPRFGMKRDRLGRRETNTDESPDNEEMVAPVRPVRLSGSGAVHIQKPVMKEGSDFAYLFTDQDEDQNDRHMDKKKASRLDALAYNEETDGEGEKYADLFEQTQQPAESRRAAMPVRTEIPETGIRPDENGRAREDAETQAALQDPPAQSVSQRAVSGETGDPSNKKHSFNRHSRSSGRRENGYGDAQAEESAPSADSARRDGRGRAEQGRDGYGPYYDDGRPRGYEYDRDRYYDRDYDGRREDYERYDRDRGYDYDYDRRYDRRYDEDEAGYRRYGHYDRYRREPEPYEAEPVYPPNGYTVIPGMYPSVMGGYQPIYYTPAPIAPGVQPVQYVQGAVYGVPVQGAPYQGVSVAGVPVQGVPVQNIAVPVPGYSYPYDPSQQPVQPGGEQQAQNAAPAETETKEPEPAPAETVPEIPQSGGSTAAKSGSGRFNRHGSHDRDRAGEAEYPSYKARQPEETSYSGTPERDTGAPSPEFSIPTEDSIPHFRPRSRSHTAAAKETAPEQPEGTYDAPPADDGNASAESKPAESRFRRRHS